MSPGKIAAQAAHAAVEAYRLSAPAHSVDPQDNSLVKEWYKGKHYKKLVMEARDSEHLFTIKHYLEDRGFKVALIVDEGLTEVEPHSATAMGVVIVDKDDPHTAATFSTFKLLKPPKPQQKKSKLPWK